jgi:drug/metabolite transporter (DMT)-like permease
VDGIVLTPNLFSLKPGFVVFIIHFIPFAFMSLFFYSEFRHIKSFSSKDWLAFLLIAITGGSLGTLAIVKALFLVHFQKLTVVVLLQKLQPVFAITLAAIFLKERLHSGFIKWAVLALISAYLMSFGFSLPSLDLSNNALKAYFYAVIAAFFFASGTVVSRYLSRSYNFKTATFYRYGFTTVFMLFWVILTGDISNAMQTNSHHWLIILLIAFTTGSGAIYLYYYGLKKVTASVSTICELCFPITAMILDFILHGNQLSFVQWFSAFLLVLSILMISRFHINSQNN